MTARNPVLLAVYFPSYSGSDDEKRKASQTWTKMTSVEVQQRATQAELLLQKRQRVEQLAGYLRSIDVDLNNLSG